MLLQAGADPAPDPTSGHTPLETALYHGSLAAAVLLALHTISPLALWSASPIDRRCPDPRRRPSRCPVAEP
jgi:ankyrin repeat protein